MKYLTVLLPLIFLTDVAFSELVCERPDGCRWIGNTCQDCIEAPPPPKPERKVPSEVHHHNYEINITSQKRIIEKESVREYIVSRPPSIQFSSPEIVLSGLSRDSSGWRFRAKNRLGYECLLPPLRPGDISGNFSCGGTPTNYFVFF